MPQNPAARAIANAAGAEDARGEPLGEEAPKTQTVDPLIGKVVHGRFKVVSVIARGGMGKVYKAEQAPLGRVCALKVLSPKYEGDKDPDFHKRFFLEAATAAKLTHPNTVTIFDYGADEDIYYIAMEFIEGRTLYRLLRDEGPFSEQRTAHLTKQICRALREAHGLGVIHRDLKPGNVLVSTHGDEKDFVKVLDFGLVKDVTGEKEDLTQQGLFMGSPKYMAPEQILGLEVSPRTDIYALGVMMYEMLCGRVPFDKGAGVGTLMAHVHAQPPPMQSNLPDLMISEAMEAIVYRCLEKDPAKRFGSMNELLGALRSLGGDEAMLEGNSDGISSLISRSALRAAAAAPSGHGDTTPYGRNALSKRDTSGPHTLRTSYPGVPPEPRMSVPPSNPNTDISPGPSAMPVASLLEPPQPKKSPVPWVIAGAAVLGIIGVVVATRGSSQTNAGPAEGTPSQAPTAAPVVTSQPTATPAVTATASAAPAIVERKVHIESTPPGAAVLENGKAICSATPCDVTYTGDEAAAEHKIMFSKSGFKTSNTTIKPGDGSVSGTLVPVPTQKTVPEGYKDF